MRDFSILGHKTAKISGRGITFAYVGPAASMRSFGGGGGRVSPGLRGFSGMVPGTRMLVQDVAFTV